MQLQRKRATAALAAIAGVLTHGPAHAQGNAVESFYKGRTIDVNIGFTVGGTYDLYGRLLARHMGRHIPGNPQLIPKQMVGAGTRVAANYVYAVAAKDGTQLGVADQALPLQQSLGEPGIQFDARRLNWIGNPNADINVMAAWHTAGITRIEDAKTREFTVASNGVTAAAQNAQAMNALIGTRFKILTGYPGGSEINLALERGEVAIRGQNAYSSWKATHRHWLDQKKLVILMQVGLEKHPELAEVPLMTDLAPTPEAREIFKLLSAPTALGRPLFTTPDVPADRLAALRAAFDAAVKDPEFIADAKKAGLEINPVRGVDLQRIVGEMVDAPKAVTQRLGGILSELYKMK